MTPTASIPTRALPRGVFHYKIDVLSRANPRIELEGNAGSGPWREVVATVTHPDAEAGARDVMDMIIWGDVDPCFHPRIAPTFAASQPMLFRSSVPIVLSAVGGVKTINVMLRFRSGRTVTGTTQYVLFDTTPHVTILRQPYQTFLSSTDTVELCWGCSQPFTRFAVCIAPSYDAGRTDCAPIMSGVNTFSIGSFTAGTAIETSFTYANAQAAVQDLAATVPLPSITQLGQAFVKVFCLVGGNFTS